RAAGGGFLPAADREHQPRAAAAQAGGGRVPPRQGDRQPAGRAEPHRGLHPGGCEVLMPKLTIAKNNFTAGEIAPDLWGRSDLQGYVNGAARLRNVLLRPAGGVTRRPGLRHVALLPGIAALRLAAFAFNMAQTYLLGFCPGELRVWRDDEEVFAGAAPWTADMLPNLTWTQSADTLFLCHPDLPPQRITRRSHTDWQIADFTFAPD